MATTAGTIMAPQGANSDEDLYTLGSFSAGNTIELDIRLPSSSTLIPRVRLLDSAGNEIADEAFAKWLANKPSLVELTDPIAGQIEEALARFAKDKKFKLGNYGYTVKKAKGKGASGFVASRNKKPA